MYHKFHSQNTQSHNVYFKETLIPKAHTLKILITINSNFSILSLIVFTLTKFNVFSQNIATPVTYTLKIGSAQSSHSKYSVNQLNSKNTKSYYVYSNTNCTQSQSSHFKNALSKAQTLKMFQNSHFYNSQEHKFYSQNTLLLLNLLLENTHAHS